MWIPLESIKIANFLLFSMIDLILCKDKFDDFGFSRIYEVKINRINSMNNIRRLNEYINVAEGCNLNREILSSKNIDILVGFRVRFRFRQLCKADLSKRLQTFGFH